MSTNTIINNINNINNTSKTSPRNIKKQTIIVRSDKDYGKVKEEMIEKELSSKSPSKIRSTSSYLKNVGNVNNHKRLYKKPPNLVEEIKETLEETKRNRVEIDKALEFIKTLESGNQEQRCIEHNNVVTLYCMNDHKLMCVYCIYGVNKHRTHKILPINENMAYVVNDVNKLKELFSKELRRFEDIIDETKQNNEIFKKIMKETLNKLEDEYLKRKEEIDAIYLKEKNLITERYEKLIETSESLLSNFGEIKYGIWEYQAKYNMNRTKIGEVKETLSHHVNLEFILNLVNKIELKPILRNEIEKRVFAKNDITLINIHSINNILPSSLETSRQSTAIKFTKNNDKKQK